MAAWNRVFCSTVIGRAHNDVRVALVYVSNDGVRMYKCWCVWLVFHVAYDTDDDGPTVVFP